MQNLRNFYVENAVLEHRWSTLNKENAEVLLQPIKDVMRVETFVLTLLFPAMDEGMHADTNYEFAFWTSRSGWEGVGP